MKLKLMLIAILMLGITSCGSVSKRTNENGSADAFHVGLGALSYSAVYYMLPDDMHTFYKIPISFGTVVGCHWFIKENLYDKNASKKDTLGYAVGAFGAGFMIPIVEW